MKIKNYSAFINEEIGIKDALIGATMFTTSILPEELPAKFPQYQTEIKQQHILSTVSGPVGIQSVKNPDLDLVHGVLGSKRLDDDFESRVSKELKRLNDKGYKTDVSNIRVNTYIKDGKIITESSCDIIESKDGNSYSVFTTRGSIGKDFEERHDSQVKGLESKLSNHFHGQVKKIKTILVSFKLDDKTISYKQSFFVTSKSKVVEVEGQNLKDLRDKLKTKTIGQSIDVSSVEIDIDNMKVTFNGGNTKISNLSIVFDDRGNLDNRFLEIKKQNNLKILERGYLNGVEWALLLIY